MLGTGTSTVNTPCNTAAMSHLKTRWMSCNVCCGTNCSWPKWTKKSKLYPKKSGIQIKVMQLQTEHNESPVLWVGVCMCAACVFIFSKENKTCITNFYSTSGTALPPLLSALVMQPASGISNTLDFCRKCAVCSFEINSIPIISYLLNGSYSCDFRTSLSQTANEFIVLIIMPGSPGWEIWSVKYSLILERSWQTSLTHSITQSPHIIDLVAHCFSEC